MSYGRISQTTRGIATGERRRDIYMYIQTREKRGAYKTIQRGIYNDREKREREKNTIQSIYSIEYTTSHDIYNTHDNTQEIYYTRDILHKIHETHHGPDGHVGRIW